MRGFVTVFLKHARSVRFEITADAFYVRALEMKVGEIINENYFINDMKKNRLASQTFVSTSQASRKPTPDKGDHQNKQLKIRRFVSVV